MQSVARVSDALLFVLDTAHTLHAMVSVYPAGVRLFVSCDGAGAGDSAMLRQLVNVYELTIAVSATQPGQPSAQLAGAVQPVLVQLFDSLLRPALLEPGMGKRTFEVLTTMHSWVKGGGLPDGTAPALLSEWAVQYGAMAALGRLNLEGQLDEPQCQQLAGLLLSQPFIPTNTAPAAAAGGGGGSGGGGGGSSDPDVQMVKEFAGVGLAVGETVIQLAPPPSTFSRCINRDGEGLAAK